MDFLQLLAVLLLIVPVRHRGRRRPRLDAHSSMLADGAWADRAGAQPGRSGRLDHRLALRGSRSRRARIRALSPFRGERAGACLAAREPKLPRGVTRRKPWIRHSMSASSRGMLWTIWPCTLSWIVALPAMGLRPTHLCGPRPSRSITIGGQSSSPSASGSSSAASASKVISFSRSPVVPPSAG